MMSNPLHNKLPIEMILKKDGTKYIIEMFKQILKYVVKYNNLAKNDKDNKEYWVIFNSMMEGFFVLTRKSYAFLFYYEYQCKTHGVLICTL